MSKIGTLLTGAGIQTTIAGQAQAEEFILIGDVDTANPLQGLQVEIDGTPFINIQSANLINAFMKWQQQIAGAVVGLMIKVATGMIGRNTTYRFTNAGATTPNIYAFSDSKNGIPIVATTKTVNAQSLEDFSKFSALFLDTPANVSSIEVVWKDGHKSTIGIQEADAYFNFKHQAEANGELGGVTVLDNTDQMIQSVRVNTSAAGAVTVLIAKIPNEAFQALKQ